MGGKRNPSRRLTRLGSAIMIVLWDCGPPDLIA
jgi:hypothetical protein